MLAIDMEIYNPKTSDMYEDNGAAGNRHGKPDYTNPLTQGELREMSSVQLHHANPLQDPGQRLDGSTLRYLATMAKLKYYPSNG